MNIIFSKILSLSKPLWSPVVNSQTHLAQLWQPFVVFSIIEITFKIIGYWISSSYFGIAITESIAYFLRIFFEVALLSQLVLILNKQPKPSSIFYFKFEPTIKVIYTRILMMIAFIMPLLILANVFGLQPDVAPAGFSYVLAYIIFTLWTYCVIFFYFAWWFNTWAIVYEDKGPIESFHTSLSLTRKHWFATAWFVIERVIRFLVVGVILGTLIALAIGSAANGIGHLIHGTSSTETLVIGSFEKFTGFLLIKILLGFPMQGFVAIAAVSQYFHLQRQRKIELEEDA